MFHILFCLVTASTHGLSTRSIFRRLSQRPAVNVKNSSPLTFDLDMGAYIHIPFCRRRCFYCDFPIQVVGERKSTQVELSEAYARLLYREIDSFVSCWHDHVEMPLAQLRTVYFGGGTPSLMTDACLHNILEKLDQTMGISSDAEITLEMDPGTFDAARLRTLAAMGFNRVSVGIQSFDYLILSKAGRAHTSKDSHAALDILSAQSYLKSYSVDLIASLPYLTPALWAQTLDTALRYRPPHVSVYDLQIEERSAFGRWYAPYTAPLPDERDSVGMYTTAVEKLVSEGGYEHYELSNYAVSPAHRSRHNQRYWQCRDTAAFGLGAASYLGGRRFTRPSSMQAYEDFVSLAEQSEDVYRDILGRYAAETASGAVSTVVPPDLEEFIMLSLRTADGLDMERLLRLYGTHVSSKVDRALADYRTDVHENEVLQKIGSVWRLRDPHGFLLSNDIISNVFAKLK